MSNDDHKGIVNILNLPHRYREENPRVPFKSPELTTSEILMKMKPIELPKSVPEKKDEDGYTKKQNQQILNHMIRPKLKNKELEIAEKQWTKEARQPDSRGMFQREVARQKKNGTYGPGNKKFNMTKHVVDTINKYEDGPNIPQQVNKRVINKSLNKFENRTSNKDVVTFDPTTQLFTDETRNIAFKSYDKAKKWNDAVNGQPTATSKQVNDLDQRLKRNGFTGSSTKPFIKKKKITTPIEPVKIDIGAYTSFLPTPIRKDPELIRQEQNIMRIKDQMDREKIKRATTGIAGLVGGDPFVK